MARASLFASVAFGAVAGAVTALLVSAATTSDADGRPVEPLPQQRPGPGAGLEEQTPSDVAVAAQLGALRRENAALRERLETLEDRPEPVIRVPADGTVSRAEFEAFRQEVRGWLATRPTNATAPVEFKDQVAEALTTIRKEEAIGKVRAEHEQRAAKLDNRLAALTERLDLDERQAREMRAIITARDEHERQLIAMWENGVDDQVLGETKRVQAETFRAELERVLTPAQLETLQSGRGAPDKR